MSPRRPAERPTAHESRQSVVFARRRWPAVLLLASALPLLISLVLTVAAVNLVSSQANRLSYASQAYFDTRYYDEVLTMSAKMAAVTGDPMWTQRYRSAQVALADSLDVALAEASGVELVELVATSTANDALVAIEENALAAVAQGDLASAQKLMGSTEYAQLKSEYADSVADAELVFEATAAHDLTTWTRLLALQFGMLALSMAWIVVVAVLLLRAWRRRALAQIGELHADLRESDERFQRAMRESAIGMCIADPGGAFVEVNPALCEFFGYSEDELRARTWQQLTWPDDLERDLDQVRRVVAGELDHFQMRKRYRHQDGRMLIGDLTVSGIRDDSGELAYFLAQIVDITARAEAEAAKAESEQRFRLLAENATDVVFRTTDADIVTWVSPAIADTLGWQPADVLGQEMCRLVYPDDRREARTTLCAAGAGANPGSSTALVRFLTSPIPTSDTRAATDVHATAQAVPHRWVSVRATQILDAQGQPDGLVLGVQDVDELVRTRSEMAVVRRAEERLRLFMQSAAVGMAIAALDGQLVTVNPALATLLGVLPAELAGRTLTDLTHPDDRAALAAARTAVAGGDSTNAAVRQRLRTPTGDFIWVDLSLAPVRYPDGSLRHFVTQVVDVSAEVANFEALRLSEEQFRLAIDGAPQGVALTDADGVLIEVNPALCDLLGHSEGDLVGRAMAEIFQATEGAEADIPDAAENESCPQHSHRFLTPTGEIWVEHSIGELRDDHGELKFCVHQFTDQTAARAHQADLERRATRDPLTGVANRAEVLAQLRARLTTHAEDPDLVGVLFCDVDNLKHINDAFGHACGDVALTSAADRLVAAVRGSDTVGRMGGDEFVVVMSHFRRHSDFVRVVANIQHRVSRPITCDGAVRELTISVGARLAPVGADPEQVLAQADQALYRAKQAGRNQVAFHEESGGNALP